MFQVLQARGSRKVGAESRAVVVEADVAVVDRGGALLGVQTQAVGHLVEQRRVIRLEDPGVQGTRQECVVHAVQDVREWRVLRQDRLVDHRAGVAALQHLDDHAMLLLEPGKHAV